MRQPIRNLGVALLLLLGAAVFVGESLAQATGTINKEKVDLLINGGTVVTMDGDRLILEDGAVVVKGDVISAIGFRTDLEKKYIADQTIDARGKLVLPGFINGHTHVPMTLFRGLHDDVTLDEWLHKYIFPAEAKKRYRRICALGYASGSGGANSRWYHDFCGHVLLRRRRCGGD